MSQDHIDILRAFDELKFNLGKITLLDFIKGDPNKTIEKNGLDELNAYGCLYMLDKGEILHIIDQLIIHKYLEVVSIHGGFQVLRRTFAGTKEIVEKKFIPKAFSDSAKKVEFKFKEYKITDEDKKLITNFSFFLETYKQSKTK